MCLRACTIGVAEGTRDSNCKPTRYYIGHTDPGNGADNLGRFSYQHGARSPEEADRKQLKRLRIAEIELQAAATAKFGRPLSKIAIATGLDLWNQSPEAATDFVQHLPTANPTEKQIVKARSQSYVDLETGQLDAPSLGNSHKQVEADQAWRTGEVINHLQHRRLNELNK